MQAPPRKYTRKEKLTRAGLLVQGAKGAYGDIGKVERAIETIDARAEERAREETAAWEREVKAARADVAAAKVRERAARGADRTAARQTRREAEKRLKAVERTRP
ncbi:hypothetical protein [Streptomyces sp. NPDC048172]|uniref:hypothetical protein n=1 Tax=Streptomyces sp. NPDC048172 TaxID=3365505 RepID=UPI00371BEA24